MTDNVTQAVVIQGDRDAAWPDLSRVVSQYGNAMYDKSGLDRGWYDTNYRVQAFARHRIAFANEERPAETGEAIERPRMTGKEWSAQPENVRRYIMMLETDCDPSGTIRSEMILRDYVELLEARINELGKTCPAEPVDLDADAERGALVREANDMLLMDYSIGSMRDTIRKLVAALETPPASVDATINAIDRDIAIGEHAFRAGFEAGMIYEAAGEFPVSCADTPDVDQAWSAYTPPEDLCGG